MVLECYFDGANQADSIEYKVVTLACIAGTENQWEPCLQQWQSVVTQFGPGYLHTTDAIGFSRDFKREKGWDEEKRDRLFFGCVGVAREHFAHLLGKIPTVPGLLAHTTTINLQDFQRARLENSQVPPDANEICATQAIASCFQWAKNYDSIEGYRLVFDQNEPFRGHIWDRYSNPKVKKRYPHYSGIIEISEANMRFKPALQIADLLAWCVSHKDEPHQFAWQEELLSRPWWQEHGKYEQIIKPVPGVLETWRSFNLPKRKRHP